MAVYLRSTSLLGTCSYFELSTVFVAEEPLDRCFELRQINLAHVVAFLRHLEYVLRRLRISAAGVASWLAHQP
jgi:hypothetical protein